MILIIKFVWALAIVVHVLFVNTNTTLWLRKMVRVLLSICSFIWQNLREGQLWQLLLHRLSMFTDRSHSSWVVIGSSKLSPDLLSKVLLEFSLVIPHSYQIMLKIIVMWDRRWVHLFNCSLFILSLRRRCLIQILNNLTAFASDTSSKIVKALSLFECAGFSACNSSSRLGIIPASKRSVVRTALIEILFNNIIIVSILISDLILKMISLSVRAVTVFLNRLCSLVHDLINISLDLLSKSSFNFLIKSMFFTESSSYLITFVFLTSKYYYALSW